MGEEEQQPISILLPPTYMIQTKDTLLCIIFMDSGVLLQHTAFLYSIGDQMKSGELEEFIIVSVNGYNKLGGSFYVNSPVIGNWEII